ncbi:acyl-CoA dehydrogenase family protein [Actinoplanes sp. NPDC020271]|uniref:acyl-CoA dehydrogenase family protein n=1 Tax=Actinoplanes sp. NPDC020271 TaxID=3363896 RepID=UPI0037B0C353
MSVDTTAAPAATTSPRERAEAVLPVLREHARAVDTEARFPTEALTALRGSGLLGLLVPDEYGGLGGDLHDLAQIADLLGGACLSTAMIWAMHCQQVAAIVEFAGPQLRAGLLPQIARGEVYIASVTSEKGKGGHLLSAQDALERSDERLHLHRDAPIVTGGLHADGFLITMRDLPDAPAGKVSLVYAPRAALNLTTSGSWNPLGMRGTHSIAMVLDATLDPTAIVGEPGGFQQVAVRTFAPVGHVAWAACWLGAARGALRDVLHLVRSPAGRKQFSLDSELLRARVARARMDLDTMAALLAQCISDARDTASVEEIPVQLRLNALKVYTAERSFAVVNTLTEIVGLRHGYMRDAPLGLERVLRDLRSASLNYANDRLIAANGAMALLDNGVHLAY